MSSLRRFHLPRARCARLANLVRCPAAPHRETFNPVIQLDHARPCTGSRTQVLLSSFRSLVTRVKGSDSKTLPALFCEPAIVLRHRCRTALFARRKPACAARSLFVELRAAVLYDVSRIVSSPLIFLFKREAPVCSRVRALCTGPNIAGHLSID